MALRLRRGTEAERQTINPAQGELLYVTDEKKLYVGDGTTTGDTAHGVLVGPRDLSNDTSPQLAGDLDLNGNDITGTGNINITGTITATGNINLGDGAEDVVNIGGYVRSNITPNVDDTYSLGTSSRQWANIWSTQVNVDTTLAVGSRILKLTDGSEDSTKILWDAENDAIYGNFYGSVFTDDSALTMVDTTSGELNANAGVISSIKSDYITATSDNNGLGDNTVKVSFNDGGQERLTIEGITDGTYGLLSVVPFRAYKGTDLDNKADTTAGDILGGFGIDGYRTTGYVNAVNALGAWNSDADFNEDFPGAKLTYLIGSNNSTFPTQFIMDGGLGTFSAPVLKAGSYATGDIPTGADVGAGSIVFDSTTNEFKGWNGTSWVVLG
jgi:hypothetical protein